MTNLRMTLALCFLLVAALLNPAAAQTGPPIEGGPPGMGGPSFLENVFPPSLIMRHQSEIGLTDAQREAITKQMEETREGAGHAPVGRRAGVGKARQAARGRARRRGGRTASGRPGHERRGAAQEGAPHAADPDQERSDAGAAGETPPAAAGAPRQPATGGLTARLAQRLSKVIQADAYSHQWPPQPLQLPRLQPPQLDPAAMGAA